MSPFAASMALDKFATACNQVAPLPPGGLLPSTRIGQDKTGSSNCKDPHFKKNPVNKKIKRAEK
jgi:hypothetical protein